MKLKKRDIIRKEFSDFYCKNGQKKIPATNEGQRCRNQQLK